MVTHFLGLYRIPYCTSLGFSSRFTGSLFCQRIIVFNYGLIGEPLKVDASTVALVRLSMAQVFVEVNLQQELPDKLWIGNGSVSGFWQRVKYENLPDFCSTCSKVGHRAQACRMGTGKDLGVRHQAELQRQA